MADTVRPVHVRLAGPADAAAIAALHADSWRRHYRGAYADAFLDGDIDEDRLAVWTERLGAAAGETCTIVAEDGGALVGFAHTVFDEHPTWGALLDNLHVVFARKRSGIGTRLMAETAATVTARSPDGGLHLWVLEQNTAGQAFYSSLGGRSVERALVSGPGGDPSRLNGSPAAFRYAWPDPAVLLASVGGSGHDDVVGGRP